MRIVFSGGGTMGSVSPLIAQINYLLSRHGFMPTDFLWIGTQHGQEEKVVKRYGIKYYSIPAGKIRRYFAWQNFIDPFKTVRGYIQALEYLFKFKPDLIVTAGSFVSVPVIYAAKTLGIKILIHQLDLRPGLANRLMSRIADKITVSWPELLNKFSNKKVVWVGTPIRKHILEPISGTLTPQLNLDDNLPLILVMGGGTGAARINEIITQALTSLLDKYQVVHLTGRNKTVKVKIDSQYKNRYLQFEFVYEDLGYLMHQADLIICRAGIGTISEILAIGKPAIVIPIPGSHQEINAGHFADQGAIKMVNQENLNAAKLCDEINKLLDSKVAQNNLITNGQLLVKKNANELLAQEILKFK